MMTDEKALKILKLVIYFIVVGLIIIKEYIKDEHDKEFVNHIILYVIAVFAILL